MSNYSDASIVMYPSSRKTSEIYSQKPVDDSGNLVFSCNTARDEINSLGVSTEVAVNIPRYDHKEDYVVPVDNSYYNSNGTARLTQLPKDVINGVASDFEITLFLKTGDNVTTGEHLLDYYTSATDRFSVRISSGLITTSIVDSTSHNSSGAIVANTSYMVSLSWDSVTKTNTLYIDKVAQVGVSSTTTGSTNTFLFLGARNGNSDFAIVQWSKMMVDNRVLTTQERLDYFNNSPIPYKYKGADNTGYFDEVTALLLGNASRIGGEFTFTGDSSTNGFGMNFLWIANLYDEKVISVSYEVVSNTLTGDTSLYTGNYSSSEIFQNDPIDSSIGVHIITKIPDRTGDRNKMFIYIGNSSNGGQIVVKNVKVIKSGNTLNLSTGKTVSNWYDLDHGITGVVTGASLTNSTDFGSNFNGVSTCPKLLLEPSFTNYFLNSRTPVTQTVSGLSVGEEYTINCKNSGIIVAVEPGGEGQGGTITEVYPFTYKATQTSILLTLSAGNSFEFVQLSNTSSEMNHVETLGVSVTKALDTASKTGLASYIDSESGVLQVAMSALFNSQVANGISLSDGTTNNRVNIEYSTSSNSIFVVVTVGGVTVYSTTQSLTDITVSSIIKVKWGSSDFGVKIDSVEVDSQSSGISFAASVLTDLRLDSGGGGSTLQARLDNILTYKGILNY